MAAQITVVENEIIVDVSGVSLLAPLVAAASGSAALAAQWANEDEDVVVAGGEYSAKHYMAKAAAEKVAAQAARDEAAAEAASISGVSDLLMETVFLGKQTTPITGSNLSAGTYVLNDPKSEDYVAEQIEVFAAGSGTLKFVAFDQSGTTFTANGTPLSVPVVAGLNTVAVNIPIAAGQYLGFYTPATMTRNVAAVTADGGGVFSTASDATASSFIDATATTTSQAQVRVTVARQAVTTSALQATVDKTDHIASAFTLEEPRNLFDTSRCLDGRAYTLSSGADGAAPDNIALGYQAVEPGKTYAYRIWGDIGFAPSKSFVCRSALTSGYLGVVPNNGVNTYPANPPIVTWVDDRTAIIEVPALSAVRYMAINTRKLPGHTTADFERVIATVQLQEGDEPTQLEPVTTTGFAKLNPLSLPTEEADFISPDCLEGALGRITIKGQEIYVRTWFSDALDLIQRVSLNELGERNLLTQLEGVVYAARDAKNTLAAFNTPTDSAGLKLATQDNDAGPDNFQGSHIGASHGWDDARLITDTAHGKTQVDVGSLWLDAQGKTWTLMQIPELDPTNKLVILCENGAVFPAFDYPVNVGTAGDATGVAITQTLTHVSGATNTADINATFVDEMMIHPSTCQHQQRLILDGTPIELADGENICRDMFIIAERYGVMNLAVMQQIVQDNVGSPTPVDYEAAYESGAYPQLVDEWKLQAYCYSVGGGLAIPSSGYSTRALGEFVNINLTQAPLVEVGAHHDHLYIPRVLPFTALGATYDFREAPDLFGVSSPAELYGPASSAEWEDINDPPAEMAHIIRDGSGNLIFSFMAGYNEFIGGGVPALRKTLVSRATTFGGAAEGSTKLKLYPRFIEGAGTAIGGDILPANYHWNGVVFRGFTSPDLVPEASVFFWYQVGTDIYVRADFHQNVENLLLPLPARFIGRTVTVGRKSASLTLHTADMVDEAGLRVTVTGGRGYLSVKLT